METTTTTPSRPAPTVTLAHGMAGWTATFTDHARMPNGRPLPLPFGEGAPLHIVAGDIRRRFPGIAVFYRNKMGYRARCAEEA
jgi:hypothetical protein